MNGDVILVQLVGFVAMAFGLSSYQPKLRKNILYLQLLSNFFWVVHFSLVGATTGAALNASGALRAYMFNRYGSKKHRSLWTLVAIIGVMTMVSFLTWQGVLSLLPLTGMIIATVGFWQRNEQRIRLIVFFASPLWLTYNAFSGSYAGMVNEIFAMISVILALWRFRKLGLDRPAVQKSS